MRSAVLCVIVLAASVAAGQSNTAVPKSCIGLDQQRAALNDGSASESRPALSALEAKSAACLHDLLTHLPPEQQRTGFAALSVYEAATSQTTEQLRRSDAAEAQAQFARETREAVYQMASLFARLTELTYRFNRLVDDVGKTSGSASSSLPAKVEYLNCNDYRVGRFDACWPPD